MTQSHPPDHEQPLTKLSGGLTEGMYNYTVDGGVQKYSSEFCRVQLQFSFLDLFWQLGDAGNRCC